MIELHQLPHERRNFVHKRIGRGLKTFVTSGFNPISAAGAFIAPARNTVPRTETARPSARGAAGVALGRSVKFSTPGFAGTTGTAVMLSGAGGSACFPGFKRDPVSGRCVPFFLGDRQGPDDRPLQLGSGVPVGDATMGRFGAALVPGSRIIDRAVCLRGMVLGNDGLCYNSKGFRNSDRMWPRGRKPLLTGGDMRAISIASRAATRLTNTAVRLQEIGLIKKPVARKRAKKKS